MMKLIILIIALLGVVDGENDAIHDIFYHPSSRLTANVESDNRPEYVPKVMNIAEAEKFNQEIEQVEERVKVPLESDKIVEIETSDQDQVVMEMQFDEVDEQQFLRAFAIEYAEEEKLTELMLIAYEKVALENDRPNGYLFPRDIYALMYATLNPEGDTVHPEEDEHIRAAAEELCQHQGLSDENTPVHNGFITRGSPLQYMRRLAVEMHHKRRRLTSNH